MTLSEIRSLLRILIDQPHTGIWSNASLNTLINGAYRNSINEITERNANYYVKTTTVSTVASTDFADLPSDCTLLKKLVDADGDTLVYRNSNQFDHSASNAEPEYFDVVGRHVWFSPTPDSVYAYTAWHHYLPSDMSLDTDTPELPPNSHDIIAYGAAIISRIAKEDQTQEYMIMYEQKKKALLHQIGISQTDVPPRVQGSYDDFSIFD